MCIQTYLEGEGEEGGGCKKETQNEILTSTLRNNHIQFMFGQKVLEAQSAGFRRLKAFGFTRPTVYFRTARLEYLKVERQNRRNIVQTEDFYIR